MYKRKDKKGLARILVGFLSMSCLSLTAYAQADGVANELITKPRVIVLTDIMNEPDDQESLVRFLVYSNEYDVEGLIATTSVYLRNRTAKERIIKLVEAYGEVRSNLLLHASGFPTKEYLLGVTKAHLPLMGMEGVGDDKNSEGSQLIIEAVDRGDSRPVWVTAWGGVSCLAQALYTVRKSRSKEELAKFVAKLRVYTISDQDDSGRWLRIEFPDLFYVVSPSSLGPNEYHKATWTGISGDKHNKNGPMIDFELVSNEWLTKNIIENHGPLGALYPKLAYIMEGDTPSFLGLINNGLGSSLSPGYGGWGGRYVLAQTYAETHPIWTNNTFSRDEVLAKDGQTYVSDQATIWRWREAYQHDFAARMDWCIEPKEKSNHNPIVTINGNSAKEVIHLTAKPKDKIVLDAKGTSDPDGNALAFNWFLYREPGRYMGPAPELSGDKTSTLTIKLPQLTRPTDLHFICEVKDNGTPALVSYRRVIVSVKQ